MTSADTRVLLEALASADSGDVAAVLFDGKRLEDLQSEARRKCCGKERAHGVVDSR